LLTTLVMLEAVAVWWCQGGQPWPHPAHWQHCAGGGYVGLPLHPL